jgi:hypothetical protein
MAEGNYGLIVHAGEVLPWGWSCQLIGPKMFRLVTPPDPTGSTWSERALGVIVPVVGHPLVGTESERRAYAELQAWRASEPHDEDEPERPNVGNLAKKPPKRLATIPEPESLPPSPRRGATLRRPHPGRQCRA